MSAGAYKPSKPALVPASRAAAVPKRASGSGSGASGFNGGMGIPPAGLGQPRATTVPIPPRSTTPSSVTQLPDGAAAAVAFNQPGLRIPGPELQRFPGTFPDPNRFPSVPKSFSCSKITADFLRESVLRDQDILLVDLVGTVNFDRTPGVHTIQLLPQSDRLTAPGKAGAFYIGQGQALILTDFKAFAVIPNVGLPGGIVHIDPYSLLGQVTFSLVSQEGGHPFNQQSSTPSGTSSGTSILDFPLREGHPVITSTVKTGNITAIYNVVNPPFPGFPSAVGVNVKGYLVDGVLLKQIQDVCVDMSTPVLG